MRRDFLRTTILAFVMGVTLLGAYAQERSVEEYLGRSEELYNLGLYREAKMELQRAAAAAVRLSSVDEVTLGEVEFLSAICDARLGDGTEALEGFLAHRPTSPYRNEALMALGTEYYEKEMWEDAVECFERVDTELLSASQLERMAFECGHAHYNLSRVAESRQWLSKVVHSETYGSHARYMLGYFAYQEEDYPTARHIFLSFADDELYSGVIAYYLLHVEYRMKNYDYVVANVDQVLTGVGGSRHQELHRMGAECQFRVENWEEAYKHIAALESEIGDAISREENYIAGYSLYRLGQTSKAAGYLQAACGAEDSMTRNAAYHLADCLLREGDKLGAMKSFSMSYLPEGNDPLSEDALYNYCKLLVELGGANFDEEILTLRSFIERYPASENRQEIEGYLVSVCYAANDLKLAYETLEAFGTIKGNIGKAMQSVAYYYAVECYELERYEEAKEYAEIALDLSHKNRDIAARTLFLLGHLDYRSGEYKMAAAMYKEYLSMKMTHHEDYPYAYYNMAYAKYARGDYNGAHKDFLSFLDLHSAKDEFYEDSYSCMGDAMAAAGKYKRAIEDYKKITGEEFHSRYYAAYRIAQMYGLSKDVPSRLAALEEIVTLDEGPYVEDAHYEWGATLISDGQFGAAQEVIGSYLKRYPRSRERAIAQGNLALAYRNTGDTDSALAIYKNIVAEGHGSMAAHNALGEIRTIYLERNNIDGFFAYADQVGMNSDLGAVQRDSLSFVAAQRVYILGDKKTAAASFDKYLKDYPSGIYSDAALYYSADCRAELGDKGGAQEQLRMLSQMGHNKYTRRGYEKMARVAADNGDWATMTTAYHWLLEESNSPSERREVMADYFASAMNSGDGGLIVDAAQYVEAQADAPAALVRRARFERAKVEEQRGNRNEAVEIYNLLRRNVANIEGAESAYRVVEIAYESGNYSRAEELVYEFASKSTPHQYWLAKSFLLLGDMFVIKGNLFQARATYQSVVDGYANQKDGIIAEAKARVESLNNPETTN